MGIRVHLLATNTDLRKGLLAGLHNAPPEVVVQADGLGGDALDGSDVIVTPVGDCSPARCARLAQTGARVIVLAPVPRESERIQYTLAGAARYLPMSASAGALLEAVTTVMRGDSQLQP